MKKMIKSLTIPSDDIQLLGHNFDYYYYYYKITIWF